MSTAEDLIRRRDNEEEYFFRQNQELIRRKRLELDVKRIPQHHPHWMKCPKCGANMSEIDLSGIKVEQCLACEGVYFDRGEVETLLESHEPKGFLRSMKRIFRSEKDTTI